eukprot:12169412-Alexandrium_andersonii.AAC.1
MHRHAPTCAQASARPWFLAEGLHDARWGDGRKSHVRAPPALLLQDGATQRWGAAMSIRKRSADGWRQHEAFP